MTMEKKYYALVTDKFHAMKNHKTRFYTTVYAAYQAGWKLAEKYYSNGRGAVKVYERDNNDLCFYPYLKGEEDHG